MHHDIGKYPPPTQHRIPLGACAAPIQPQAHTGYAVREFDAR